MAIGYRKSSASKGIDPINAIIDAGKQLEQLRKCVSAVDTLRRAHIAADEHAVEFERIIDERRTDTVDYLKQTILGVTNAY